MTHTKSYLALEPYFANNIDYSNEVAKFDEFTYYCEKLLSDLSQKFDIRVFGKTPGNYRKCYTLSVFFDDKKSPIPPIDQMRILNEEVSYYRLEIDISVKAPFCTYTICRSPTVKDEELWGTPSWIYHNNDSELSSLAQKWVDWLCKSEGVTYVPFEQLREQIPDTFDDATLNNSTLYSMIFTEE